jgi:uncharacterized protein DUF1360
VTNLLTLAALSLASYRATQLVVWDTIGDPLRQRLELWHAVKHTSRFRSFVRALIKCPYCVGWWLSMITYITYATATGWSGTPLLVHAISAWAVAGGQALLNRWDDSRPGHNPEG